MAAKSRSAEGCWTCRLRRKKCDEGHPVCAACAALEIDCLYSDIKPTWMDGGDRQRERADRLKAEVKLKAGARREKKYLHGLETEMEDLTMSTYADGSDVDFARISPGLVVATEGAASTTSSNMVSGTPCDSGTESLGHVDHPMGSNVDLTPASSFELGAGAGEVPWVHNASLLAFPDFVQERELSSIMIYLDYVFPFLFSFYRPPLLEGGRSWLLVLLMRNKTLFHTALSLASYFFSVVLDGTASGHEVCKVHNWEELQKQQDLSLRELLREVQEINRRGVADYLIESSRVYESVVQLLTFEVAIANTGNWPMHLDAAVALFDQIMTAHAVGPGGKACWFQLLNGLGPEGVYNIKLPDGLGKQPYTSNQAAMRFFTAVLIPFDIISSTATGQPPRLQKYHASLLTPAGSDPQYVKPDVGAPPNPLTLPPPMQLEKFIGLENWVLLSIAAISALDAWKKEMRRAGSLSMVELVARASAIGAELRAHIAASERSDATPREPPSACPTNTNASPLAPLTQYGLQNQAGLGSAPPPAGNAGAALSRVWAQAALTYLSVVVSGWQPASAETRASVTAAMAMLARVPSPACLRTMVWPFCITGCMALPGEERAFRDLVAAMGPLKVFGTVREALAIMEYVWQHRMQIEESDSWDLAACFSCLGHKSLLI